MGNMEERQLEMKKKLQSIVLEESIEGITLTGNAAREITNISIDPKYHTPQSNEALEDLLVVAMNNLLAEIAEIEAAESQNMLNDMLPPGMAGLFEG